MNVPEPAAGHWFDALRRTLHNLHALLASRVELASVELAEEKYRVAQIVFLAHGAALFGLLTLLCATSAVVVLTWDTAARFWVLPAFTLVYAGAAFWSYRRLRARLKNDPAPFARTLEEFRQDRACFSNKS